MLFTEARMFRRVVRQKLDALLQDVPPDLAMDELACAAGRALAASPAGENWFSRRTAALFLARQMVREADAERGARCQDLRPANDAHA